MVIPYNQTEMVPSVEVQVAKQTLKKETGFQEAPEVALSV